MSRKYRSGRQGIRRVVGLVSLLAFPVTMNFMSPYLSQIGAWTGIISGSVMVFASLFVSAILMGRSFCGWVCPAGALQDLVRPARNRRVTGGRWVKFAIWGLWLMSLLAGFYFNRPLRIEFLYMTESGVSVSEPFQFIIYAGVAGIFLLLALIIGRRGACHTICWMAPFMAGGRYIANYLNIPRLRIRSTPDSCTSCGSCVRACPMSLDVTAMALSGNPENPDCAFCGECVDVCPERTLNFGFGIR